jgi:hypothetical protein
LSVFRATALVALPVAVIVVLISVHAEGARAFIAGMLGVAWLAVAASALRGRWSVAIASCGGAIVTVGWTALVVLGATPCALSGRGILKATPECPVQATHVVGAIVGAASCITLAAGVVSGLLYARRGDARWQGLFRGALLLGAGLVIAWLAADLLLPRNAPSD